MAQFHSFDLRKILEKNSKHLKIVDLPVKIYKGHTVDELCIFMIELWKEIKVKIKKFERTYLPNTLPLYICDDDDDVERDKAGQSLHEFWRLLSSLEMVELRK